MAILTQAQLHPEPLSQEQIVLRAIFFGALLVSLAVTIYALSRGPTIARIRSSGGRRLLLWWSIPAAAWAVSLLAGDAVLTWLDGWGYPVADSIFVLTAVGLLILPCAALMATVIWAIGRMRIRTRSDCARAPRPG